MCVVCLFPKKKKHFFMKKYFFRILHYSTALQESSPIMKIINFHEKPWFSLIFIDFYQKSWKLMVLSGPKVLPHPSLCQKRRAPCFCFPRIKHFLWKNIFSHFALLYGSARVEPDHENHQIFMKNHGFHWFSMIFIDFYQKSWKLMVFNAPERLPHPVLGQK